MTARKSSISLIDQMVVSGTNFIITVLLSRLGGPEELAKYLLGFPLKLSGVSADTLREYLRLYEEGSLEKLGECLSQTHTIHKTALGSWLIPRFQLFEKVQVVAV